MAAQKRYPNAAKLRLPALCQGGLWCMSPTPNVPTCPIPPDANGSTSTVVTPDLPVLTSGSAP